MSIVHDNQLSKNEPKQIPLDQLNQCTESFRRYRNDSLRITHFDNDQYEERPVLDKTQQQSNLSNNFEHNGYVRESIPAKNDNDLPVHVEAFNADDEELNEFEHNVCTLGLLARLEELEQDEIQKRLITELQRKLNGPRPRTICCTDEIRMARRRKRMKHRRNYFENCYFDNDNNEDCAGNKLSVDTKPLSEAGAYDDFIKTIDIKYWLFGRHSLPDKLEAIEESSSDDDYPGDEDQILCELNEIFAKSKASACEHSDTAKVLKNACGQLHGLLTNGQNCSSNRSNSHGFGRKGGNFVFNIDLSTALTQLNERNSPPPPSMCDIVASNTSGETLSSDEPFNGSSELSSLMCTDKSESIDMPVSSNTDNLMESSEKSLSSCCDNSCVDYNTEKSTVRHNEGDDGHNNGGVSCDLSQSVEEGDDKKTFAEVGKDGFLCNDGKVMPAEMVSCNGEKEEALLKIEDIHRSVTCDNECLQRLIASDEMQEGNTCGINNEISVRTSISSFLSKEETTKSIPSPNHVSLFVSNATPIENNDNSNSRKEKIDTVESLSSNDFDAKQTLGILSDQCKNDECRKANAFEAQTNTKAEKSIPLTCNAPFKQMNHSAARSFSFDFTQISRRYGSKSADTGHPLTLNNGNDAYFDDQLNRNEPNSMWIRGLISPPVKSVDSTKTDKCYKPRRFTASLPRNVERGSTSVNNQNSLLQFHSEMNSNPLPLNFDRDLAVRRDPARVDNDEFNFERLGSPKSLNSSFVNDRTSRTKYYRAKTLGGYCFPNQKNLLPSHVVDICRNSWPDDQSLNYPNYGDRKHTGSATALGNAGQSIDSYLKGISIVTKLLDLDTERLERFRRIEYIDKRIEQIEAEEQNNEQVLVLQKQTEADSRKVNAVSSSLIGRWSKWQQRCSLSEQVERTRMVVLKLESEIEALQSKIQRAAECNGERDLLSVKFKLLREARRKFDELEFSLVELETKFAADEGTLMSDTQLQVKPSLHIAESETNRTLQRVHSLRSDSKKANVSQHQNSFISSDGLVENNRERKGSSSFSIRANSDFCNSCTNRGFDKFSNLRGQKNVDLKDQLYRSLEHEREQVSIIERTIQSLRAKLNRPFLSRSDSGTYEDNSIRRLGETLANTDEGSSHKSNFVTRDDKIVGSDIAFSGNGTISSSESPGYSQFIQPVPSEYPSPCAVMFHRFEGRSTSPRCDTSDEIVAGRDSETIHDRLTPCSTHTSSCSPRSTDNSIARRLRNVSFQNSTSNDILSGKSSDDLSSQERDEHSVATNILLSLSDSVRLRSIRCAKQERPLTRYLPLPGLDLDLRQHVENAGHMIDQNNKYINVTKTCCRGHLIKMGQRFRTWHKRWFVFDRNKRTFAYYHTHASERKGRCRGQASFQSICEVYVDHLNMVKSPSPRSTFVVKTMMRTFYLVAPSAETMRIWVDVLITGAEGHLEYQD